MAEILISGSIEGGDGAGKFTTQNIVNSRLFAAERIEVNGVEYHADEFALVTTNFPTYCFPSGMVVRAMNRGWGDEFFTRQCPTFADRLNLKKAGFALDRLFTMILVENVYQEIGLPILV